MRGRLIVTSGLVALAVSGCADPCLDDGLGQEDCAADSVGTDSNSGTRTESDSNATDSVSATESDSRGTDSMSGTESETDGTESDSITDSSTDSDTDSDTDTDGETVEYCVDGDDDGFGDGTDCVDVPTGETPPDGSVPNGDDCDDESDTTFPGAAPNDDATACMRDEDDDDYGDDNPPGGVTPGTDCIDTNVNAYPGAAQNDSKEACMEDEDGDGYGDSDPPAGAIAGTDCNDSDNTVPSISECLVWCLDSDMDNYGDPDNCIVSRVIPDGYVGNDSDCDDTNPNTFPGAAPNDDALACMKDDDGDDYGDDMPPAGVDPGTDCADDNINAFPGSSPNDSLTACMEDEDGDDYGDETPPAGVDPGTDCDDSSIATFPGAAPLDDANACMLDEDGDDYGDDDPPAGVDPGTDCADDNANAFPGAAPNDSLTACMEDEDGDDYGDDMPPPGVDPGTDCVDDNINTFPGAAPLDDPPDACMEDEDGDDYGDDMPPAGAVPGLDCNDANPAVPIDLTGLPETCGEAALAAGSLGCEFHAVPLPNIVSATIPNEFDVAISNPSSTFTAAVTIEEFGVGGWTTVSGPTNVGPQSQIQVNLPITGAQTSGVFGGGSYRISSNLPIAAYQRAFRQFTTDASLLLPASTWATDYHVVGWDALQVPGLTLEEYVAVVSRTDGTVVTVDPSQDIVGGGAVPAALAGVPFNLTLDEGDVAIIASNGAGAGIAESLSGTVITATEPVGVFSGTECSNVGPGTQFCDHLEEMMLPAANAATNYVAARAPVRNGVNPEPAIWQVYALEDATVSFDAAPGITGLPPGVSALAAGESLSLTVSGPTANPGDFIVNSVGNVLVAQYFTGSQGGGGTGDPAMVQLPASSQLLSDYAVGTYPGFAIHHLTVTRPVGSIVTVDGAAIPAGSFIPVGVGNEWEVARVAVAEGTHLLDGEEPFSVMSSGYNVDDSYGYAGGLRTNDLVCTIPDP